MSFFKMATLHLKVELRVISARKLFSVCVLTEIKVLEKWLDFVFIQFKINEPKLRQDFNVFCSRMHLRWYFQNETQNFNETPAFSTKAS